MPPLADLKSDRRIYSKTSDSNFGTSSLPLNDAGKTGAKHKYEIELAQTKIEKKIGRV